MAVEHAVCFSFLCTLGHCGTQVDSIYVGSDYGLMIFGFSELCVHVGASCNLLPLTIDVCR